MELTFAVWSVLMAGLQAIYETGAVDQFDAEEIKAAQAWLEAHTPRDFREWELRGDN